MRYIVTFRKRYDQAGDSAENPSTLVDAADGVILDSEVVQEIEPAGLGVTDDLGGEPGSENANDDGFLAFGTESWIYEVADGREEEFINALRNSEVVLEFHEFDDEMIRKPFAEG
ncbi:MAG TPA: hypothetical protein VN442_00035 [Bryobacteraceae bacterium]|nr:hypothetical protein [Bryobacteraceae bacterium]